jgi:hypothetical protein
MNRRRSYERDRMTLHFTKSPPTEAGMPIRRSEHTVFESLADPSGTTRVLVHEDQRACTAPKCWFMGGLRGPAVLVDHTAEHFPAPHRRAGRHEDRPVMVGWPLAPGLVRPVPVVIPGVGPVPLQNSSRRLTSGVRGVVHAAL